MSTTTLRPEVMLEAMSACRAMMHTDRETCRAGYSAPNAVMATRDWMRITHGIAMKDDEAASLLRIAENPENGWAD